MTDILISDFTDNVFQNAFKLYFKELGIEVKNWNALFEEITNENGNNAFVRLGERENIIGFVMFKAKKLCNWFFEESIGFIREFWVAKDYRNNGHGSDLLKLAEDFFKKNQIKKAILTTDTAQRFYELHGYFKDTAYVAKNDDAVFIKYL